MPYVKVVLVDVKSVGSIHPVPPAGVNKVVLSA